MKPHPPGAVASLACAVLSAMLWWLPVVAGPLAVIALILGARSVRAASAAEPGAYQPPALATAAQVIALIALVVMVVAALVLVALVAALGALAPGLPAAPVLHPVPML